MLNVKYKMLNVKWEMGLANMASNYHIPIMIIM